MDFIEGEKAKYPEIAAYYESFGELYQQKLWHQLSAALFEFLSLRENCRASSFYDLYTQFISNFETRLNQVTLAQVGCFVASTLVDPKSAIAFLESILADKNRTRLGEEASMVLDMEILVMKVQTGELADAKVLLEEGKDKLAQKLSGAESVVFSKFYKAETEYRKAVGPPQEFYRAGLMFLVYTPCDKLPADERYVLATDMAVAAMTADDVYNFGEVIATPILLSLENTPNAWMRELVMSMNNGNITGFNAIVDSCKDQYYGQPALAARHEVVKQKLLLLALINMVSKMSSHNRIIPFQSIAETCMCPLDQVEWVLMRAMSLNLIKGTMDEVQRTVQVTWVMPRVLDMEQIASLGSLIGGWKTKVGETLVTLEEQTIEIC